MGHSELDAFAAASVVEADKAEFDDPSWLWTANFGPEWELATWQREMHVLTRALAALQRLRDLALADPEYARRKADELRPELDPDAPELNAADEELVAAYFDEYYKLCEGWLAGARREIVATARAGQGRGLPRAPLRLSPPRRGPRARRRRTTRRARAPARSSDDPDPAGLTLARPCAGVSAWAAA